MPGLLKRLKGMCRTLVMTMRYGHEIYWPKPEDKIRMYKVHELIFDRHSFSGFKIKYKLTIDTQAEVPTKHPETLFINKSHLDDLFKTFNETFLQWMKETDRFFYINGVNGYARVIHLTKDGAIKDEINCSDTVKEFQKIKLSKWGCRAQLILLDAWIDRDDAGLIRENYSMIDNSIGNDLREQIEARKIKEAWVVTLLNERIKVQETWKKHLYFGSNRMHKGMLFNLQTESRGNEVVIKWNFNDSDDNQQFHLRGFRREDSFPLDTDDKAQGVLVIDRWGDDWATEHLEAGKTYFYTLKVSRKQIKWDSLISKKACEVEQEIFRFEITTLPKGCLENLEHKLAKWVEQIKTQQAVLPAPLSPERKKINQLVEYLDSYVEFDDALTQREKVLIKEMDEKKYSPKERKDKIERLKLVVEELRQQHS